MLDLQEDGGPGGQCAGGGGVKGCFSKPPWEEQPFIYDFKNLQNFCFLGALTDPDRGCESTSIIKFQKYKESKEIIQSTY